MEFFIDECYCQRELIEKMIEAGSYDGISGKGELSVDGMNFDDEHLNVIKQIINIVKQCL